jgi:hypothetical protein
MDDIAQLYLSGMSIHQVSKDTGVPLSTVRFRLKKLGILRSRAEGLKLASTQGRLGVHMLGVSRTFTDEHKAAISEGRKRWSKLNAKGVSLKPNGYLEYTLGPNKHRSVHVVSMEEHIGRRIVPGECVHHIDGDKQNNDLSNLRLMTISEHTRLHRLQEADGGKFRVRNKDGRFC